MKKFLFNKKTLYLILLILLLGNSLLLYFLFSSPKVLILNRSTAFNLNYTSSKEFNDFMTEIQKKPPIHEKDTNAIQQLKIIVINGKATRGSKYPFTLTLDSVDPKTGTLTIWLAIDKSKTDKLNSKLTYAILQTLIDKLYPDDINEKKEPSLQTTVNQFQDNIPPSFSLSKK